LGPAPLEAIWQAAGHAAAEIPGTEATTVPAHAATSAAATHASILQGDETQPPGGDQSEIGNAEAVHLNTLRENKKEAVTST
jgi:hypothetical protein